MTRIATLLAPALLIACGSADGLFPIDAYIGDGAGGYGDYTYDYGEDDGGRDYNDGSGYADGSGYDDPEGTGLYASSDVRLIGELPTIGTIDPDAATGEIYLDDWMVVVDLDVRHEDGTFAMLIGSASLDAPLVPGTSTSVDPFGMLGCSGIDGTFDFDVAPQDATLTTTELDDGGLEIELVVTFDDQPDLIGVAVVPPGE